MRGHKGCQRSNGFGMMMMASETSIEVMERQNGIAIASAGVSRIVGVFLRVISYYIGKING